MHPFLKRFSSDSSGSGTSNLSKSSGKEPIEVLILRLYYLVNQIHGQEIYKFDTLIAIIEDDLYRVTIQHHLLPC